MPVASRGCAGCRRRGDEAVLPYPAAQQVLDGGGLGGGLGFGMIQRVGGGAAQPLTLPSPSNRRGDRFGRLHNWGADLRYEYDLGRWCERGLGLRCRRGLSLRCEHGLGP
ncbi:hypothetical protein SAV31267_070990 [Streptomyces avermitilis]|uniref:Uncharacterized protein n=1 Tax=Streptomyces avermitilis TaxID=33903 RepID=A0A4D4N0S2_STRAX|nr:hypothetical protein SAV31267_070990 [Streptomyces avermitilis]